MEAKFPGFREKVLAAFHAQGVVHTLNIEIEDFGEGWFVSTLVPGEKVSQHHGFVHAGVLATMADLSGGYAAYSLMEENQEVLTVEFKINLFRPALGDLIICRAKVLKPGRRIYFSESEIFSRREDEEKLIAKAAVTLAVIQQ